MNETEFSTCDDTEFLQAQFESGKLVLAPRASVCF